MTITTSAHNLILWLKKQLWLALLSKVLFLLAKLLKKKHLTDLVTFNSFYKTSILLFLSQALSSIFYKIIFFNP